MNSTVRQLADLVGGRVDGDGEVVIEAALPLCDAGRRAITFVENERNYSELATSLAAAAVVALDAPPIAKPLIRVADPRAGAIELGRGGRSIEAHADRTSDRRIQAGEDHVAAADRGDLGADFRAEFVIEIGVVHLRHLLGRVQAASECLIHEIHGNVLSGWENKMGWPRTRRRQHARTRI